jgi:hypothetical protein
LNRKALPPREQERYRDAVLIETYFDCVRSGRRERFAFVTYNKHDFSDMTTHQKAHPELASGFSKINPVFHYPDCLRRIDPAFVQEIIWGTAMNNQYDRL